jgi:hypothetical protein
MRRRSDAGTNKIVSEFIDRHARHRFNESGHFKQSYWATQLFFILKPDAKAVIQALPDDQPIEIQAELLEDWRYFLHSNRCDRSDVLGFDLEVLYRGLHENLGGRLTSGGGAGYPLKIVMRLVADL